MCAISLYHYDACIYIDSRGKSEILSGRPRDLRHCIFHHRFGFLGANHCIFLPLEHVWEFGRVFADGGEFPLTCIVVVGLGDGVEHCC